MKNSFKSYALIWAVLFILFNAVVFLVRPVIPGYIIQYDARFWIAWVFIILSFAGNLLCTYITLKQDNLKKIFYHLPLITISRTALIAMGVAGIILMLIPNFPAWITAIVCILIFAFNAIAIMKASWAADAVANIDEKIKTKTSFIKNATVDAESILARTKNPEIKADCKKVYEAIRQGDAGTLEFKGTRFMAFQPE